MQEQDRPRTHRPKDANDDEIGCRIRLPVSRPSRPEGPPHPQSRGMRPRRQCERPIGGTVEGRRFASRVRDRLDGPGQSVPRLDGAHLGQAAVGVAVAGYLVPLLLDGSDEVGPPPHPLTNREKRNPSSSQGVEECFSHMGVGTIVEREGHGSSPPRTSVEDACIEDLADPRDASDDGDAVCGIRHGVEDRGRRPLPSSTSAEPLDHSRAPRWTVG